MKFKTVREGQQAVVFNHLGEGRLIVGPERVFLYRERLQYLKPYTADPFQFLILKDNDGILTHKRGPCEIFHNPMIYESITVRDATRIDANHLIVVYKRLKDDDVQRRIIQGPTVFVPEAEEWVHQFKWHGTDSSDKTRMIPGHNQFTQLAVIPDQFYYNVREVRTNDDVMITVKLMIFYEMKDILKMFCQGGCDGRTYHGGSSSDPHSDSDQSISFSADRRYKGIRGRDEGDGASADKNSFSGYGIYMGASQPSASPSSPMSKNISKSKSTDHISSKDSGTELEDNTAVVDKSQYEDLLHEYQELSVTMTMTKKELLRLQDLLLCGEPPDGEEEVKTEVIGASSPTEQVVILKSQLVQSTEVCKDLKDELSTTKNECMQLQGTKAGLLQRLTEQDETISQLKAEILRRDFERQRYESEKTEVQKICQDKDQTILDLRKDITRLHDRLRKVGQTGANLSARVASQDKRMARLEGKILLSNNSDGSGHSEPRPGFGSGDELQVVRDSLHSLRLSFKGTDPQQHTIDTLEQSVSALLDKLQMSSNSSVSSGHSQSGSDIAVSRRLNFDSTGDVRRSPIVAIPGSTGSFSLNHLEGPGPATSSPTSSQNITKVLYFTDKSISPYSCNIPKRLGDITLKDFKEIHDRPGNYRYSFKALDPEFGTVKEEIMCDTDIIPGWEGKIVAWIEEDTG